MSELARRAALIFNPASGQLSNRRAAVVRDAADVFRAAGFEAKLLETDGPGSAGEIARRCAEDGFDTVVACGGDGTVHEVIQSLVGTQVALGVIPLGTANVMAVNLGLPRAPARAALLLAEARPVRIPVGLIHYLDREGRPASRYFLVAAGIGPDALMMASLDPWLKRRIGYLLYVIEGFRIWATSRFPLFEVDLDTREDAPEQVEVSELLAVRIPTFGGALGRLVPGANLLSPRMHLVGFGTRSRFEYLGFVTAAIVGQHNFRHAIRLHEAHAVDCRPHPGHKETIFVEADGELLGTLPARMEMIPDALTVLVPDGVNL